MIDINDFPSVVQESGTHAVATAVCATVGVYTLRVARAFPLVAYCTAHTHLAQAA